MEPLTISFRKEDCEKELNQLEKDLEKLNKGLVVVDTQC